MLRCVSPYRNLALGLNLQPGEVLRDLTTDQEEYLLRDSPGSFEPFHETVAAAAARERALQDDAPSPKAQRQREKEKRAASEHPPADVMTPGSMPGLTRQ
jgi:hypothetical protein